ncbi:MAG TPA: hypothetical protein PLR56_06035 [Brevefilum sp.]|nr:hypothetical protein [Brevefilum sp.]
MIIGNELEQKVFEKDHINRVVDELTKGFETYFESFRLEPLNAMFAEYISEHQNEQDAYAEYLDMDVLEEYGFDPNAFKAYTRSRCPIIHRCLWSQDEIMKSYKRAFNETSGREILDAVKNISLFGTKYVDEFDDDAHEDLAYPADIGLETLNDSEYLVPGVIGYGIQSTLLYGVYPRQFARRSQNSVWSLYFLSNRKDFGLLDGSEFLLVKADKGTTEQNFLYPVQLFGFYALQVCLLLKYACEERGLILDNAYRYVYLEAFNDYVANLHWSDINILRRSSEDVELQPWF